MKMKIFGFIFAAATLGFLAGASFSSPTVHAQNPNITPYQFAVSSPHTTCNLSVSGQANYCYGSDGPFVSINGAPYVSMIGATGATGPQGPTGATGATGPQGPAGAAGSIPTSFTCSGFTLNNTAGASLSRCP